MKFLLKNFSGNIAFLFGQLKLNLKPIFWPISCDKSSTIKVGHQFRLINSTIRLRDGASLEVGENVTLANVEIAVRNGVCRIGSSTFLESGSVSSSRVKILVEDGSLIIGHHSRIRSKIWVRFKGQCSIGNYTVINEKTFVRCDKSVSIGNFCMISYDCLIFDTNTHRIYSREEYERITIDKFPKFQEYKTPQTKKVFIGSHCWLGQGSTVLKGSHLSDGTIIGARTTFTEKTKENEVVVSAKARVKVVESPRV